MVSLIKGLKNIKFCDILGTEYDSAGYQHIKLYRPPDYFYTASNGTTISSIAPHAELHFEGGPTKSGAILFRYPSDGSDGVTAIGEMITAGSISSYNGYQSETSPDTGPALIFDSGEKTRPNNDYFHFYGDNNSLRLALTHTGAEFEGTVHVLGDHNVDGAFTADTVYANEYLNLPPIADPLTINDLTVTNSVAVGYLDAVGNITGSAVNAIDVNTTYVTATGRISGDTLYGMVMTANQPNITAVGTLDSLNITGTATMDTCNATNYLNLPPASVPDPLTVTTLNATDISGTLTTAAQPNITAVGTLDNLTISGNLIVNGTIIGKNLLLLLITCPKNIVKLTMFLCSFTGNMTYPIYTYTALSSAVSVTTANVVYNVTSTTISTPGTYSIYYIVYGSSAHLMGLTVMGAPADNTSLTTFSVLPAPYCYKLIPSSGVTDRLYVATPHDPNITIVSNPVTIYLNVGVTVATSTRTITGQILIEQVG